jgi:hypothetical protein
VEANAEFLAWARREVKRGGPIRQLDLSEGAALDLSHLAQTRALARMFSLATVVGGRDGQTPAAVENAVAIMQLGGALASEPTLISQLVRIAINSISFSTVYEAFPPGTLSEEQTQALLDQAAQAGNHQAFADSLDGEGAIGLTSFDQIRSGDFEGFDQEISGFSIVTRLYATPLGAPWLHMDETAYAETMTRVAEASALPYYEAAPILEQLDQEVARLPFTRVITQTTVPALARAAQAQARHEAHLDLMRVGLLVERHQVQHGSLPESLGAIAPGLGGTVPVDPFTGEPYRYVVQGESFHLYSVGRNGADDGGLFNYREGDIVWRAEHHDR